MQSEKHICSAETFKSECLDKKRKGHEIKKGDASTSDASPYSIKLSVILTEPESDYNSASFLQACFRYSS